MSIMTTNNNTFGDIKGRCGLSLSVGQEVWALGCRDVPLEGTIVSIKNGRADVLIGDIVWSFEKESLSFRGKKDESS